MKTTASAPAVSSLSQNAVKDIFSVEELPEEYRILQLTGEPVRVEVTDKYIEVQSYDKDLDFKPTNFDLDKIREFFYGTGYVYGFYGSDKKFIVYDVFTNGNFLSTRDLNILENSFGIEVAKPMLEGNLSTKEIISFYHSFVVGSNCDPLTFRILPSVYINDQRNSYSVAPVSYPKVIWGERPKYVNSWSSYGGYYGTSNWDYGTSNWDYGKSSYTPPEKKEEKKVAPPKEEKKADVFLLTTKEERDSIFKETWKNVNEYVKKHDANIGFMAKEWLEKRGKTFIYLYSIMTLPQTRQLVYDFANINNYIDVGMASTFDIPEWWTTVLFDYFEVEFEAELKRAKKIITALDEEYFTTIMEDELMSFELFYEKENIGIDTLEDVDVEIVKGDE